jgi:hypothetical protein
VILEHEGQTLSLYIHMKQNGITVELGDTVRQGDLLGYWGRVDLAGEFPERAGQARRGRAEGVTCTAGVCRQPAP